MSDPAVPVEPAVVVETPNAGLLTVWNWVRDTAERSVVTFVIGIVALGGVDYFSNFHADWGRKVATAGLIALAAFVKNAALPKSGLGLPPLLDVIARAGWSAAQAGAAVVLANVWLDWFTVTAWQTVGAAALAAALSVLKGLVALHVRPDATVTPAALA